MAKIKNPLLSGTAWGTFAKALSFARNPYGQYAKKKGIPLDKRSAAQDYQRLRFSCCMIVWSAITSTSKEIWGRFLMLKPWCKTNPFLHTNLSTGYPCRETPFLPGMPYNRKSEWIVGLARIGITPIGTKLMNVLE